MTSHMNLIELRQREILECIKSLNILLPQSFITCIGSAYGPQIQLELKRIERYAQDTMCTAISYSEALLHARREKRRRHRKNIEITKKLQALRSSVDNCNYGYN